MSPASAVAGAPHCFRFSPLGRDMPLFTHPISQGADITAAAAAAQRPRSAQASCSLPGYRGDRERARPAVYYGIGKSLALYVDGLFKNNIQVCDLSGADGSWANLPPAGSPYDAAIDPHLGRIALPPIAGAAPRVQASFYYGFNADMGGGEYPRASSFADKPAAAPSKAPRTSRWCACRATIQPSRPPSTHSPATASSRSPTAIATQQACAHRKRQPQRPHRTARPRRLPPGPRAEGGEMTVTGGKDSAFDLNGLVVTSSVAPANPTPATLIRVPANLSGGGANQLSNLGVTHCTLVPGWALAPDGDPQFGGQPDPDRGTGRRAGDDRQIHPRRDADS